MIEERKKCVVIAGPTASGKSALALKLASESPCVIINADSMQVYNDLSILTACPSDKDKKKATFCLYGVFAGDKTCTSALWAELATEEIKKAWSENKTPIIVGGTGFYISSLIYGLAPVPDIPQKIREQVRAMDFQQAREMLKSCDIATYERFTDTHRTLRALEVYLATGKPHSAWQEEPKLKLIEANWEKIFLNPDRQELYNHCEARFLQMLDMGAIDEVQSLLAKDYPSSTPILKALGVPEIALYLQGKLTKQEMIEKAILQTRHYAKRQITWFKNNF